LPVQFERIAPPIAGEKNSIMYYETELGLITITGTIIIFQSCNAIGLIRVFGWGDDELFAYAQGLDKRVEKIACV